MDDSLTKKARKASADPVQEKLRQHKSNWNRDVSGLISGLITLKKAINGKGDLEAGLPPSNIKDPFPSEVTSYLSHLSSEYLRLANDASKIIEEQSYYSANRKKKASQEDLISQASWAGSRLRAKLPFIGGLRKDPNRKLRIRLISFCANTQDLLKTLESDILTKDHSGLVNAVSRLAVLHDDYLKLFSEVFDSYNELSGHVEESSSPEEVHGLLQPSSKQVETKPAGPSDLGKEKSKSSLSPAVDPAPPPSPSPPSPSPPAKEVAKKDERLKGLDSDLVNISILVKHIEKLPDAKQEEKSKFLEKYLEIEKLVIALKKVASDPESTAKDKSNLDKQLNKLVNLVEKFKNQITKFLGQDKDFNQHLNDVMNDSSHVAEAMARIHYMEKIADGAFSKWINKIRLNFDSSNLALLKLDILNNIKKTRKSLDNLLDGLEDYSNTLPLLNSLKFEFEQSLKSVVESILVLIERQISESLHDPKDKYNVLKHIRVRELKKVKDLRDMMKNSKPLKQAPKKD